MDHHVHSSHIHLCVSSLSYPSNPFFAGTGSVDDTVVLRDVDDVIAHLDQYATDAEKLIGSCQQPLWE